MTGAVLVSCSCSLGRTSSQIMSRTGHGPSWEQTITITIIVAQYPNSAAYLSYSYDTAFKLYNRRFPAISLATTALTHPRLVLQHVERWISQTCYLGCDIYHIPLWWVVAGSTSSSCWSFFLFISIIHFPPSRLLSYCIQATPFLQHPEDRVFHRKTFWYRSVLIWALHFRLNLSVLSS